MRPCQERWTSSLPDHCISLGTCALRHVSSRILQCGTAWIATEQPDGDKLFDHDVHELLRDDDDLDDPAAGEVLRDFSPADERKGEPIEPGWDLHRCG